MLRYLTSGESHGKSLISILDGIPANIELNIDEINYELEKRQGGYGRGGRMKIEKDKINLLSLFHLMEKAKGLFAVSK